MTPSSVTFLPLSPSTLLPPFLSPIAPTSDISHTWIHPDFSCVLSVPASPSPSPAAPAAKCPSAPADTAAPSPSPAAASAAPAAPSPSAVSAPSASAPAATVATCTSVPAATCPSVPAVPAAPSPSPAAAPAATCPAPAAPAPWTECSWIFGMVWRAPCRAPPAEAEEGDQPQRSPWPELWPGSEHSTN